MKNLDHSIQDLVGGLLKRAAMLTLAAFLAASANASTLIWTNSGGTSWTSGGNWSTGSPPGTNDDAQFGLDPTGKSAIGISMSGTINNGANNEAVGAVEQTSARASNLIITNSSSSANGVLTLNSTTVNGVANVVLRNGSSANLTIADGSAKTMGLVLANPVENLIYLDGSGNLTISDLITTLGAPTPLTFAGAGSGSVAITGTGNTFTGTVSVTGAEVDFSADGSLGYATNDIVVNGGRFGIASGATVTISTNRLIFLGTNAMGVNTGTSLSAPGSAGVLTYNGPLADVPGAAGALVKQGAGTLVLGGISTFSGNVSINNGLVKLTTGNNRLPATTAIYFGQAANLGALDLDGNNQIIAGLNSTPGGNTNALAKNVVTNSSLTTATLTLSSSAANVYGDGSTNNSGIIAGPINIVVTGSGIQTLGDTNSTFGGTVTVQQGTLAVPVVNNDSANGPLGNSTTPVTLGSAGATGTLEYTGGTALSIKRFTLATSGAGAFQVDAAGQALTLDGLITGGGSLQKTGAGELVLANGEMYSGSTTISGGALALASGGSLTASAGISVGGGAIFDVSASGGFTLGSSQTLGNSSGTAVLNGNINTGSGTLSLKYPPGTPAIAVTNGSLTLAAATTVTVNNTGAALTAANYLIIATNLNGAISGTTLPSVSVGGGGMASGNAAALQIIGGQLYLVVAPSVSTTPVALITSVANGVLGLSWPANHTGWRLLVQTNHLSLGLSSNTNDWATVTGSAATNQISLPILTTKPAEFYLLVYP